MTRPRLDLVNCAVWIGMALLVVAFWATVAAITLPSVSDALSAAGALNDCRALSLSAADCTAFAQGLR